MEPGLLVTVDAWREFLRSHSADFLGSASAEELSELTDDQRAAEWLGFEGASTAELTALEERLGMALPPSYRTFLQTSNGWCHPGEVVSRLRTSGDIGW